MSQYGDEPCSVYRTTAHKARKEHKCSACDERITQGMTYQRTFLIHEGDSFTYIRCERCQVIYEHLSGRMRNGLDYDEYCDEELNCGHDYEERWEEPPPEEIAALAFWRPGDPLPERAKP